MTLHNTPDVDVDLKLSLQAVGARSSTLWRCISKGTPGPGPRVQSELWKVENVF